MIGAHGVIRAVGDRLNEALPGKVDAIRERHGYSEWELPDPAPALPYMPEITTIGDFPAILVTYQEMQQEDSTLTTPESGAFTEMYVFVYQVEVYIICRSDSYESTEVQTEIMESAVRETILQRKDISPDTLADGESIVISPVKVASQPSDVVPDGSSRFVGAVVVNFPVKVNEAVESPFVSRGVAESIPVHPALQ